MGPKTIMWPMAARARYVALNVSLGLCAVLTAGTVVPVGPKKRTSNSAKSLIGLKGMIADGSHFSRDAKRSQSKAMKLLMAKRSYA